jgi:hypothetical protein
MPRTPTQFPSLSWKFQYNDRGTHSGNYLDKLNQLVTGFNTTIEAYNAQLTAETDAESMKDLAEHFKNEARVFRDQAQDISLGSIQGTDLDLESCRVGGVDVALSTDDAPNALALNNKNPNYYQGLNHGPTTINPNDATEQVILTRHVNCPNASVYWHITTTFYHSISVTANRGQIAVQYNGGESQVWSRSSYSNTWTAWVRCDNNGQSEDSKLLNGINPAYYRGLSHGSTTMDPNDAAAPVIVTKHVNCPSKLFWWHITTTFYGVISATANRGQIAVQYNGGESQVWSRSSYNKTWTDWVRCDNEGVITLGASVDLNTKSITGLYHQRLNADALNGENYPANVAGLLTVVDSDSYIYQTYKNYSGGLTYERGKYNGRWSTWKTMYSSDYHPIAENANTVGGLALNGLRNNEANKIVKTDGSGYLQAGWINTPSGKTNTATLFACFNHTNDMYLRYMTAEYMRYRLNVDNKIIQGANANGSFTKYDDGTLIVRGRSRNVLKEGSDVHFAHALINPGSASVVLSATNGYHLATVNAVRNTHFKAHIRVANTSVPIAGYINFIAIGEWK